MKKLIPAKNNIVPALLISLIIGFLGGIAFSNYTQSIQDVKVKAGGPSTISLSDLSKKLSNIHKELNELGKIKRKLIGSMENLTGNDRRRVGDKVRDLSEEINRLAKQRDQHMEQLRQVVRRQGSQMDFTDLSQNGLNNSLKSMENSFSQVTSRLKEVEDQLSKVKSEISRLESQINSLKVNGRLPRRYRRLAEALKDLQDASHKLKGTKRALLVREAKLIATIKNIKNIIKRRFPNIPSTSPAPPAVPDSTTPPKTVGGRIGSVVGDIAKGVGLIIGVAELVDAIVEVPAETINKKLLFANYILNNEDISEGDIDLIGFIKYGIESSSERIDLGLTETKTVNEIIDSLALYLDSDETGLIIENLKKDDEFTIALEIVYHIDLETLLKKAKERNRIRERQIQGIVTGIIQGITGAAIGIIKDKVPSLLEGILKIPIPGTQIIDDLLDTPIPGTRPLFP